MRTLIKNIKLVYPGRPENGKRFDIVVENDVIKKIGTNLTARVDNTIDRKGLMCFPSLVDSQCANGEPGFEHREDFKSITKAARKGGFKHLLLLPETNPIVDNRAQVEFIHKASGLNGVSLYPYGAISKGLSGEELSEMYDMHQNGAIAFTDGKNPVSDVNMMKRALDYAKGFNGLVLSFPYDDRISPGGMVNESPSNTLLGLKSSPELAEEIMLNRDIYLLKYSEGKMHVATVSAIGSLNLIKQAKKDGLNITSGVALPNLLFTEEHLTSFDTTFKVSPALRSSKTTKALIKAVASGQIDIICTDHAPHESETKDVEFDHASYGMTGLETALAAINMKLTNDLSWDTIITAMSIKPREIFQIDQPAFKEKSSFDFVLFDPNEEWEYSSATCESKSHNSPFLNQTMKGKVIDL